MSLKCNKRLTFAGWKATWETEAELTFCSSSMKILKRNCVTIGERVSMALRIHSMLF